MSQPYWSLCLCDGFELWYVDDAGPPLPVCRCGHPDAEHLRNSGSCTGEVSIYPAIRSKP